MVGESYVQITQKYLVLNFCVLACKFCCNTPDISYVLQLSLASCMENCDKLLPQMYIVRQLVERKREGKVGKK